MSKPNGPFDPRDYEPFSGFDNVKFALAGIAVMAFPFILIALLLWGLSALL